MSIAYLDFDLQIEAVDGDYRARVLDSPAGQASADFSNPFTDLEVENVLLRIGRPRRGVRRLDSPEMEAVRQFGGRLFETVFTEEIRACLRGSLSEANRQGKGLRIKLRLNAVPELAELPWEFLYDPSLRRFFVLSYGTPIVRYMDLAEPIRPLAIKPPLSILVMISSPSDYPPLNVSQEWQRLQEALGQLETRGRVKLSRLENATLAALQQKLRRRKYHVFHYIGHGGFDPQAQDGVLLLEDEVGRGRAVSGQYLGTLLHDHRPLRLAVLNACEGARASRADPFSGTAQSLVQQGIPAVIAMQFEVTDLAAVTFAHGFYDALADSYPVDAALAEARKAIFGQENDVEWATPVLYMRSPEGRIFDIPRAQPEEATVPVDLKVVDAELEQRLRRLYTQGLSAFWLEEWEKAYRGFQSVVELRPDYQDAAEKLELARQQRAWASLYEQAVAAMDAEAWAEASSSLEKLLGEAPEYKDAADRLRTSQQKQLLGDLYAQARQLYAAKQWEAVVKVFEEIRQIKPDFEDADHLLSNAQREAEAQRSRRELEELYSQAVLDMDSGNLEEARHKLQTIRQKEAGFAESERLLAKVEAEIDKQEEAQRIRVQIASLYEQALSLGQAGRWREALAKLEDIRALDPEYQDPEGLEEQARKHISEQERETQRQSMLAKLYADAVRFLREGEYQRSLETWAEVQRFDPAYPDRQKVQLQAKRKLEALSQPSRQRTLRSIPLAGWQCRL